MRNDVWYYRCCTQYSKLANLPQYIRKQLTEKIADESSKAKKNLQTSQLNFLEKTRMA